MEIYKKWLTANGVKWEQEDFGLTFRYQGSNFVIFDNSSDPLYLAIAMPGIYELENDELKVLRVLNKINNNRKAIKAVLNDDSVWLTIEMFIDSTPDVEDFMERLLDILNQGRMLFNMEIRNA